MNKRKIIGILGWKVGDNSYGATSTYLDFISKFGTPKIIMPEEQPEDMNIDVLLLPGGQDLNPHSYGQVPGYSTGDTDVHKQYFYDTKLDWFIQNNFPIYGICLGHQMIAAKFGIPLTQDLPFHEQSTHRWEESHEIGLISQDHYTIENPTFEHLISRKFKPFKVTSYHHQGIELNNFKNSSELQPILISEDGVVEVMIHKSKPIFTVQYHPEELYDKFSMEAFKALLEYSNIPKAVY